jgi:hypothetical protein
MTRALVLLLCAAALVHTGRASCPTDPTFTGTTVLNAAADFNVSWVIANNALTLKLIAKTTGWIGFGFGEQNSGSMVCVLVKKRGRKRKKKSWKAATRGRNREERGCICS